MSAIAEGTASAGRQAARPSPPSRFFPVARALALGLAAVLLAACGSSAPGPGRRPPEPAASDPGRWDSAWTPIPAAELPFPEARDSLSWESPPARPDSAAQAKHGPAPAAPSLPPVSRPEGIRQRARPAGLSDRVHVLLSRSAKPLSVYSLGEVDAFAEKPGVSNKGVTLEKLARLKGRFLIRRAGGAFAIEQGGKAAASSSARRLRLISANPYNLIDLGGGVYRGGMHLIAQADGTVLAVNVLGVEDYLRGVLPYEMGKVDRDGLEALKAQAIVARTYAYKRMLKAGGADFQLYSDVQDQVYKGVRGEYLMADRAVWETRGMAVFHADTLAQCYYFSTCGGRTAGKHEVWGGDSIPYLVSRPDTDGIGEPFCRASKYMSWTQEWTRPQLAAILKRNLRTAGVPDFPSFSGIEGISVAQRSGCGRVRELDIQTDRGVIPVRGDKTRWALRPSGSEDKILPSAWFSVKAEGGRITVQGKGFGHGVGLCQMGALARAKADQNFVQIIRAYFPGVEVAELR